MGLSEKKISIPAIPAFFKLCIQSFIFFFLSFSLLRFIFYLFTTSSAPTSSISTTLWAFRMGFEFDMVIASYVLIPVFLLLVIHQFWNNSYFLGAIRSLLFLFYCITVFVWSADIPYYLQFGNHLNKGALLWGNSPGFIVGMVFRNFSYWGYIFIFLAFISAGYFLFKRIFNAYRSDTARRMSIAYIIVFFVISSLLLIGGARGRLSPKSVTHEGLAVISDNGYVNNLALNPNFTFFRSILKNKDKSYSPPSDIYKKIAYTRNYLGIQGTYAENISRQITDSLPTNNYNVVVVIMESMCVYKMGYYNGPNLTPYLNSIIKESVFFDHFFSSGIHTFNGLFSSTAGYPAILDEHSLKHYNKTYFATLAKMLADKGYEGYFFTTHDPHFDNMSGFYLANGFKNIYSQYDMPSGKALSSLGVPDHVLFDKFIETMNNRKRAAPFISFMMTASDHGPWAVPKDIPFKPSATDEKQRATQYADWALGHFTTEVKKTNWYKNTIFLFLGDHGLSIEQTYEMPLSFHHIPFVVHCPQLLQPDTIHHLGYQPDVNATVMGLLHQTYTDESFGIDLFKRSHPFILITADDKIGCVDANGDYFYDLLTTGVKRLRKYENLDPADYYNSNHKLADSLENGARSILETAKYFVHQKHYVY